MGVETVLKDMVGLGSKPKASNDANRQIEEEMKKNRQSRASLFATEGGAMGQELQSGQVARRDSLFGN